MCITWRENASKPALEHSRWIGEWFQLKINMERSQGLYKLFMEYHTNTCTYSEICKMLFHMIKSSLTHCIAALALHLRPISAVLLQTDYNDWGATPPEVLVREWEKAITMIICSLLPNIMMKDNPLPSLCDVSTPENHCIHLLKKW